MNKLANMRHWPERMSPNFVMGRPSVPATSAPGTTAATVSAGITSGQVVGQVSVGVNGSVPAPEVPITYSFIVPFSFDLAGPNTEDVLHATTDAVLRWTHSEDAPDDVAAYDLPVHCDHINNLKRLCTDLTNGPLPVEAHVIETAERNGKADRIITVCLSGTPEMVYKSRESILNDIPIYLRCATIDVDGRLVCDLGAGVLKRHVIEALDFISSYCGVDIFLLGPKLIPLVDGVPGDSEMRVDQRWRIAIYGDILSMEHAKARVLVHIDQLLGREVDSTKIDSSCHPLICGRFRKNIKLIESSTATAIYFPPPFSQMYRYCPPSAHRRDPMEVFVTGNTDGIQRAKVKLNELFSATRIFIKDIAIAPAKIDSISLGRLDKVHKMMESHGAFVLLPPLACQRNVVRVQGSDHTYVDRICRELMDLTGQFYSATWAILPEPNTPSAIPDDATVRQILSDICVKSTAEVSFDRSLFTITGTDDAVKDALATIAQLDFATATSHQIRVKIELALEYKEFVSGKKNGKLNKIMSQSGIQIVFGSFNDHNFNIEVIAANYQSLEHGLGLVEQEMPASISFHVPDKYHKKIIGIGGQHIQRIMKKYSVFVKFSNAMERGGMGREDDDLKVDNVICRTPARNAQNLDSVKNEILEMIDRADSEYTTMTVNVDRLYHRELLTHLKELEQLESKHNCKIVFPSTEQASDEVVITGPQWQVSHCVDEFLGLVPDNHELVLAKTEELSRYLESSEFREGLLPRVMSQYEVRIMIQTTPYFTPSSTPGTPVTETPEETLTLLLHFTRNNAGALGDAIHYMEAELNTAGVTVNIIKGSILPRPKSDSFEESIQYFDSKILQHAPSAAETPTKATFGQEIARERSNIFDRLRKPGSMSSISSFLDRRKNSQASASSLFKGSANVSKSSLISIESTRSFHADRNPWNDSGVNLTEEDNIWGPPRAIGTSDSKLHPNVPTWGTPGSGSTSGSGSGSASISGPGSVGLTNSMSAGLGNTPISLPGFGSSNDILRRHSTRSSGDSGRPSTSNSGNSLFPPFTNGANR